MHNQILDDFRKEDKKTTPLWKYKVVGLSRLFLVLVMAGIMIRNAIDDFRAFYSEQNDEYSIGYILGLIFGFLLLVFPLIYHAHQGFIELKNYQGFSKKRRFRTAGIIFNVIFALAYAVLAFINFVQIINEDFSVRTITMLLTALIFLGLIMMILITDNCYDKASRTRI